MFAAPVTQSAADPSLSIFLSEILLLNSCARRPFGPAPSTSARLAHGVSFCRIHEPSLRSDLLTLLSLP